MKLDQHVCLDEILHKFKNGLWVKNQVTKSNLRKPCVRAEGHIFSMIIMKLYQHVCLDEISHLFEYGSCQAKAGHKVKC